MNNENSNETQIEELDDDQLQDAQGGFKAIDGLKTRLTQKESSGLRPRGSKIRNEEADVVASGGGSGI